MLFRLMYTFVFRLTTELRQQSVLHGHLMPDKSELNQYARISAMSKTIFKQKCFANSEKDCIEGRLADHFYLLTFFYCTSHYTFDQPHDRLGLNLVTDAGRLLKESQVVCNLLLHLTMRNTLRL